jgi:hypothetical protein
LRVGVGGSLPRRGDEPPAAVDVLLHLLLGEGDGLCLVAGDAVEPPEERCCRRARASRRSCPRRKPCPLARPAAPKARRLCRFHYRGRARPPPARASPGRWGYRTPRTRRPPPRAAHPAPRRSSRLRSNPPRAPRSQGHARPPTRSTKTTQPPPGQTGRPPRTFPSPVPATPRPLRSTLLPINPT